MAAYLPLAELLALEHRYAEPVRSLERCFEFDPEDEKTKAALEAVKKQQAKAAEGK